MNNLKYYRKIIFFALLFILPFNMRHIFNYDSIRELEYFREHLTLFLSPFDIGMLLIISTFIWEKWGWVKKKILSNLNLYISFVIFVAILLISAIFSENTNVAFYNSIRVIEAIFFFLIGKNVLSQNSRVFFQGSFIVFLAGVFQSIIAIFQFILQKSIGFFLLGESHLASHFLGVAKIEHAGEKLIRGYGTFPHPNILGAFLVFSFACGIFLLIWTRKESLFQRDWKSKLFSFVKEKMSFLRWDIDSMRSFYLIVGLLIISTGIVLTFSRSAWFGAGVVIVFIIGKWIIVKRHQFPIFNRSFFGNNEEKQKNRISSEQKLLLRDTFFLASLYAIIVIVFLSPLIAERICVNDCGYSNDSTEIRKEYLDTAVKVIRDNPVFGVGPGNFVVIMERYSPREFQEWEIQPVHSLYFLVTSEVGVIGLIVLVYFIVYNIKKSVFRRLFGILFLAYLFMGIFDHFFASTFQGQLLFWACLAFFASSCKIEKEDSKFDNF